MPGHLSEKIMRTSESGKKQVSKGGQKVSHFEEFFEIGRGNSELILLKFSINFNKMNFKF